MGKNSKIEWTDHTFNPWWGCVKVSEGCKNCYAETMANRFGSWWGPNAERRFFGDKHWNEPLLWNTHKYLECVECSWRGRAIHTQGALNCPECGGGCVPTRQRVFCGSMCDVFEDKEGFDSERSRLGELIRETPNLDWLLLTKRPQEISSGLSDMGFVEFPNDKLYDFHIPDNVWLGTSIENQEQANKRIPELLKIPAKVRFLSMEPLLGTVDLERTLTRKHDDFTADWLDFIDWVIVGGESGSNARPMHPDWAKSIRDQCVDAGVPLFFKQWGEWIESNKENRLVANQMYIDRNNTIFAKVGKKAAGRLLQGREWNEVPDAN